MSELEQLKFELAKIHERNKRVEKEKAWETSSIRRLSIIVLTYFVMVLVFTVIQVDKPLINAVVPTLGYFLSTVSIGAVKRWWIGERA